MSVWCEHCRGHFPEDHYVLPLEKQDGTTIENAQHGIGPEYGPVGVDLANSQLLDEIVELLRDVLKNPHIYYRGQVMEVLKEYDRING